MALIALGGLGAAATAQFAPRDPKRLVAVFPPWWGADRALAAAAEVAPVAGASGLVIGVVADRPDAASALRRRGAWFIADGAAFPACFSSSRKSP